jgi:uncharacterized membrane protein
MNQEAPLFLDAYNLDSDITFVGIHVALIFFLFLSCYMWYLKPETLLEKAVHLKAICLALVLIRAVQYRYWPGYHEAAWYGAFAWLTLSFSFVYTMYAIQQTAFGRRGREGKGNLSRLRKLRKNKGNASG